MPFTNTEHQQRYREAARRVIRDAKSVPCADCGQEYPYYVMDFDHLPGVIKAHNINKMPGRHGIDRILSEIAKCEVVCSNCHRERTFSRGSLAQR